MPSLSQIKSKELRKYLIDRGFKEVSQKGSHRKFLKGSKTTTIPMHNKPLGVGLTISIINQAGLSVEDFLKWKNKK
ncbi:MAG: type II toxin-antitoxin system HicA family toxin [Leptospiraceae bacterium]|nr:type II toxin-antitoxin system HicA family toxin [Leptospiraceae bacterium]MCB1202001.1 type II toxin-antitoxin system HicA family toxin [Leptospiraceae bacterium]